MVFAFRNRIFEVETPVKACTLIREIAI